MARPEKWKDEYIRIAEHACRLGATDHELAGMLGVSLRTVQNWRANKPKFAAALVVGKEVADNRVERGLFQRAVGYSFPSEKVFQFQGAIVRTESSSMSRRPRSPASSG